MSVKSGSDQSKQMVNSGLASSSSSSIPSQGSAGVGRQKSNPRASSAKYYDIASTILGGSGDVEEVYLNAAKNGNINKLEQLLQQRNDVGLDLDCKDKRTGNTALIWAAKRGHPRIVELLLKNGADATLCNYEAQTALETAFSPVRTILLDWVEGQDELSEKLLLQAAWQGNLSIVRKILDNKRNVNVNCQNAEGLTPLMLVSRDVQLFERLSNQLNRYYSPVQVIEELMKRKANIHVTDNDGRSSLHYAAQSRAGCADQLVSSLITGGMDVELRDKRLFTPIHLASQLGNTNNVIALVDSGSDVNVKGFAGLTPLHVTAYNDHLKTAVTLLNYGADIRITDDRGLTPADLAKTRRMKNTLKEAWVEATKSNNQGTEPSASTARQGDADEGKKKKGGNQKKKPEVIFDDLVNNNTKPSSQTNTRARELSNVEKCKQAEKKILQEVEAFKAAHPVLQRETTRMLGTTRSKVLPQIGRSSSPEHSNTRPACDSDQENLKTVEESWRSLEERRAHLISRGRSVSDIKLGVGRNSSVLGSMVPDDEINTGDGRSSVLSRTTPVPRDATMRSKARHRRSGSDPFAPSLGDLAASCDSLGPGARAKRNLRSLSLQQNSNRASPTSQIFITQKGTVIHETGKTSHDRKGHTDEDLLRSIESPLELVRCRSLLKEEFILEESRPKEMQSGSDPTSSTSSSSLSSSSPRDPLSQFSTSRSLKHDPSLDTLLEQKVSTSFTSTASDLLNNHPDGLGMKPLIRNPQQRIRRRSENSLSSSLESEAENDLRGGSRLTRSQSLKKTDGQTAFQNRSSNNSVDQHLSVYKSHSIECLSPRLQAAVSSNPTTLQKSVTGLSFSDGSLNSTQKNSTKAGRPDTVQSKETPMAKQDEPSQKRPLQKTKSDLVQDIPKPNLSHAKTSIPRSSQGTAGSKNSGIKPFSGKARVMSSADMEHWDSVSSDACTDNKTVTPAKHFQPPMKSVLNPAKSSANTHSKGICKVAKSCSAAGQDIKSSDKNSLQGRPQTVGENRPVDTTDIGKQKLLTQTKPVSDDLKSDSQKNVAKSMNITRSYSELQSTSTTGTAVKGVKKEAFAVTANKDCANTSVASSLSKTNNFKSSESISDIESQRCFVVTEESERLGSASKKRLEEKEATLNSKLKETSASKSTQKKTVQENIPVDTKTKSASRVATIEKNILRNQGKIPVNPSQQKGKVQTATKVSSKTAAGPPNSAARNTTTNSAKTKEVAAKTTTSLKSTSASSISQNSTTDAKNKNVKSLNPQTTRKSTTSSTTPSNTNTQSPVSSSKTDSKTEELNNNQTPAKPDNSSLDQPHTFPSPAFNPAVVKTGPKEPLVKIKFQYSEVSNPTPEPQPEKKFEEPICTPVIVNPFEEFVQAHIKVIENQTKDAIVKVKKSQTNKTTKKSTSSSKRPTSGSSRQTSSAGKKRVSKGKDAKSDKEPRPKSCKKSGKGKKEKQVAETVETEMTADAAKPDAALISGIGWQLSTSCIDTSTVKVTRNIHLESSDSDSDSQEEETHRTETDEELEVEFNKHLLETLKEKITEHSPRFLEMKRREGSQLDLKLPYVEDDGFPHMNLDITQQKPPNYNPRTMEEVGDIQDSLSPMTVQNNSDIQREIFIGKLTPIPETSFLSKTNDAISAFDKNVKGSKLSLLLDGSQVSDQTLRNDGNSNYEKSDCENAKSKSNRKQTNSDYYSRARDYEGIHENMSINYEYTPSGKVIRRTQSLKDYQHNDRPKRERKFSETHNTEGKHKKDDEDIDEAIEEILSSTTSSMASTIRNYSHNPGNNYPSGSHTLTDGDRALLLKMTNSSFSSPFHAQIPEQLQDCPDITVLTPTPSDAGEEDNDNEINRHRKIGSSSDSVRKSAVPYLTDNPQHQKFSSSSLVSKPPLSIRSSLNEVRTPRRNQLKRSTSIPHDHRHQNSDVAKNQIVSEEEARQLAKVINSFKHMELQPNTNRSDGFGGSAKSPTRNSKNSLGLHDSGPIARPASTGGSFKAKGKFHELKDVATSKTPTEFKDKQKSEGKAPNKNETPNEKTPIAGQSLQIVIREPEMIAAAASVEKMYQRLESEGRRGSIAGSECTVDSFKSGGDETIEWKKGNVLGRGAFGTVWCGLTNEGRLIAVKQIELTTMDKTKTQHEYEKVQEEVELLKTLEHVNIVGYLGTSLEDNIVSIFMQFVPGGSIASILARFGALDESVFRRYTKQILEGVKYLHGNDVIHRDLKGANVMLMPNGVIKLIDFGCAKRLCINLSLSQAEIFKSMKGTPFWMAPEVVNESGHGKKSDIWSIGCTVFEMATRKPPWADMNPMAAIFAIGSSSRPVPTLDEKFTQDARDFASQCLTRDQETRPDASELLDHPFITRRSRRTSKNESEA